MRRGGVGLAIHLGAWAAKPLEWCEKQLMLSTYASTMPASHRAGRTPECDVNAPENVAKRSPKLRWFKSTIGDAFFECLNPTARCRQIDLTIRAIWESRRNFLLRFLIADTQHMTLPGGH